MDSENKNNGLVVKNNNLIEAFFKMSKNEYKLTLYLISKIKKDDKNFRTQRVTIKEFSELLEISSNGRSNYIKLFEDSLLNNKVSIAYKNGNRLKINWFSSVKYIDGEGILEIKFNKDMEPYLLFITDNFTKFELKNVVKAQSVYTMRLYEIFKQYEKLGSRILEVKELRLMLGISNKYPYYANFKKKVILVGYEEMKSNSIFDIYFEFEEIKQGRRVEEIKFNVISKIVVSEIEQGQINKSESITYLIENFKSIYNGELDYNLTSKLVDVKGIACVYECIENLQNYITGKVDDVARLFFDFTMRYGTDDEYKLPQSYMGDGSKPVQMTNYEQRIYDDDFFNSLYDNVKIGDKNSVTGKK